MTRPLLLMLALLAPSIAIGQTGLVSCEFDGGVTKGDWVNVSTTSAGKCHDTGLPATPENATRIKFLVGTVVSASNDSIGTYLIDAIPNRPSNP